MESKALQTLTNHILLPGYVHIKKVKKWGYKLWLAIEVSKVYLVLLFYNNWFSRVYRLKVEYSYLLVCFISNLK